MINASLLKRRFGGDTTMIQSVKIRNVKLYSKLQDLASTEEECRTWEVNQKYGLLLFITLLNIKIIFM
jgi:hypothetical protein